MAKIDLKKTSGLPIHIENELLVCSELEISEVKAVTVGDIRPQLLNQDLTCPDIFYTKYEGFDHDGIYKEKNVKLSVLVIPPNLAGIEYVKTKATKVSHYNRVFEVTYGGGLLLIQNYEIDPEGDIVTTNLKKGQKIIVPAGYAVSFVNTRQGLLVINEVSSFAAQEEFVLDDMNGMAYYVIRKNAKQEIVKNPLYRLAKMPRKVNWDKLLISYGITLKTPLIKQILRKYEKFEWLFKKKAITI